MSAPLLEARVCPTCRSDDDSLVHAETSVEPDDWATVSFASRKLPEYLHHRLVRCPTCDTLYASPAPDPRVIRDRYERAGFESATESRFAATTYAGLVRELVLPRLGGRSRMLDVGASDGAFMLTADQLGFDQVAGVEPSVESIESADPRVRDRIVPGVFGSALFPDDRFDLITIFQTLEHVDDPLAVVSDARDLLRPGGALLVVVHDRRAFVNRVLGLRSPIYDVEHLQLFSARSIRELLVRGGLTRVETHPVTNRYPLSYWATIAPLPLRAKRRFLRLIGRTGVGRMPISMRPGNIAALGWRSESSDA